MSNELKVSFYLKREGKNGTVDTNPNEVYPIVGKIIIGKSIAQFGSKLKIEETLWDVKSGRATGKSRKATLLNREINKINLSIHAHYKEILKRTGKVTASEVKNAFQGMASAQKTLLVFFEEIMQEFQSRIGIDRAASTYPKYNMLDKASIKELVEFERFCRDNALWDEMKKCYTGDSRVNISWYQGSGHGFVDASSQMTQFAPHKIYNTEVWLKGSKAVAIMMSTVQMRHTIDGYPVEVSSDAMLIFRTQKMDGQWYIVSFESIYQKDAIIPVVPNANINIPAEEIAKYRTSYGAMIYMGKRSGMTIDENLPGIDRPDLVEKLYRETDEWLSK